MSIRFRKSVLLAPGIRWNLSSSGSSWTIGPRGASLSIGKRGTFLNTGIPGTGFSSRSRLSAPASQARSNLPPPATTIVTLACEVQDDGSLVFRDASGQLASDYLVEQAKKQKRDALLGLIQQACDTVNGKVEALGCLHHDTPDSRQKPRFSAPRFDAPAPERPVLKKLGWLDKLLSSRKTRIEEANRQAVVSHEREHAEWQRQQDDFNKAVVRRKLLVERLIYESSDAMEIFLEESLHDVVWPRETSVKLEVSSDGKGVSLDVDLPEIEDMPTKVAAVPARGLKLSVKEIPATKAKRLYAAHVHGIVFRLVGESFAALPTVQRVCASGYTQRRDPATGKLGAEYVLSVRVERSDWEVNDFEHLGAVDVVEALARFELRREMTRGGLLRAVTPY